MTNKSLKKTLNGEKDVQVGPYLQMILNGAMKERVLC